jgi:acyl-coenzyme A thioesterase PaaI-like protein
MFSPASELLDDVRGYRPFDERERAMRDRLVAFLATHEMTAFDRTLVPGHVTASARIVDPERARAVTSTAIRTCAGRRCAKRAKNRACAPCA